MPIPSEEYGPERAVRVAGKDELPSSASVTLHMAAGTEPLSYELPFVTPEMVSVGAVFDGGGEATFTVNVAVVKSNEAPVLFETCATVIVADPTESGVTVSVFVSPHDVKVAVGETLTVATAVLFEETETVSVVDAVRLQPFLPSPFLGVTVSVVVPFGPPALSGMTSAVASTEASSVLPMSSNVGPGTLGPTALVGPVGLLSQAAARASTDTERRIFFMESWRMCSITRCLIWSLRRASIKRGSVSQRVRCGSLAISKRPMALRTGLATGVPC